MTTVGYGDFCPKTNMARVRTKISSGTRGLPFETLVKL